MILLCCLLFSVELSTVDTRSRKGGDSDKIIILKTDTSRSFSSRSNTSSTGPDGNFGQDFVVVSAISRNMV